MTDSKKGFDSISKVSERKGDSSRPALIMISEDRSIIGDVLRKDARVGWQPSALESAFLLNLCSTAYDQDENVATLFAEYGLREFQIPVASSDPFARATHMTCNVVGKRTATMATAPDLPTVTFRCGGKPFLRSGRFISIEMPALYAWKPEQVPNPSAVYRPLRYSRVEEDTHFAMGSWIPLGTEIHIGDADVLTSTMGLIPNEPEGCGSGPVALVRRDVVYRPKKGSAPRMCLTILALDIDIVSSKPPSTPPAVVVHASAPKGKIASDALASSFATLAPDMEAHFSAVGGSTGKAGKQLLSSISSAIDSLRSMMEGGEVKK